MLFRLDYLNDDGSTAEAVPDPFLRGDFLSSHMTTARRAAIHRAAEAGRAILVSRIGKGGHVRPSLVILADGTASRPGGMDGGNCVRDSGRTCFCRNCRATRRAS